jgi:acyl-CoA synthetase (AMP-forming)/AMP-acid ligase II
MTSRLQGPPLPPLRCATVVEALTLAAATDRGFTYVDLREQETFRSFATTLTDARRIAGSLLAEGVRTGDRVALVLPTSPAFVATFFGVQLAGAVPVPLYPPVRLGRMEEYHRRTAAMLTASGASLVVTDDRIRRLLGRAVEAARPRLGLVTADDLKHGVATERPVVASDLAVIQFSSGTTVDAKPVALSHANVVANLASIDHFLGGSTGARHVGVSWLPLYHDMGLIGCLLEAVYHQGSLVLIPPENFLAKPALWLRALSRHRGTISPAPNFAYGLCVKRVRDEELAGLDLSSWRHALCGAEPIAPGTLRAFEGRFAPYGLSTTALNPVYGLSEASLAVTFSRADAPFETVRCDADRLARTGELVTGDHERVTVGAPVAGVEVEVRGATGVPMGEGRVGRVWVRGPNVMHGYFERPEATAAAVVDGWLDTGDLGFVSNGALSLVGRAKELVILRGANHAPQTFEECLAGLPGVRAGCAVAFGFVPDEASSEELGLLVETDGPSDEGLAERIRAEVTERTGIRPHVIELLAPGTLPRTSSGKLRRSEAARQFLAGELRPPDAVTALGMLKHLAAGEWHLWMARRGPRGDDA